MRAEPDRAGSAGPRDRRSRARLPRRHHRTAGGSVETGRDVGVEGDGAGGERASLGFAVRTGTVPAGRASLACQLQRPSAPLRGYEDGNGGMCSRTATASVAPSRSTPARWRNSLPQMVPTASAKLISCGATVPAGNPSRMCTRQCGTESWPRHCKKVSPCMTAADRGRCPAWPTSENFYK